jgi:hypothetical protein
MLDSKAQMAEFCKMCAHLSIVHDLYRSLFDTNKNQLDLYSSIAPMCFGDLNAILVEYVLLQFSKITDPAKTGKNFNLTTNYVLHEIEWPERVKELLEAVNARLMGFRKYIEPARSKRVAHIDLHSQLTQRESLGGFPKDADKRFLQDLQEFASIAYGHLHPGEHFSITVAMSTDTHKLVRALEKSAVFDQCRKCEENEKNAAILDFVQRN